MQLEKVWRYDEEIYSWFMISSQLDDFRRRVYKEKNETFIRERYIIDNETFSLYYDILRER